MTGIFVEFPMFRAKWKDLGLDDKDLRRLREEILADPKSGSVRVIYIDFEVYEKIFLITAYPENEKENLTPAERKELRQLVAILEGQLEEKEHGREN